MWRVVILNDDKCHSRIIRLDFDGVKWPITSGNVLLEAIG